MRPRHISEKIKAYPELAQTLEKKFVHNTIGIALSRYNHMGKEIVPISVNFSKNTLMYPNQLDFIQTQCEAFGEPEGMICIEITETISNMDHMEVNRIAKALHNFGFSISMDDFGTQYSNMAVLTQVV